MGRKKPTSTVPTKPTRKAKPKKTPKARFIKALAQGKSVTAAAEAGGMNRSYAYELRDKDPEFAKAWDDAIEAATDKLEDAVYSRATESSDQMAAFLLRSRRPDKYRDKRTLEHTGPNGGPIAVDDLTNLTEAQRTARVAALLDAARTRAAGQAVADGSTVAAAAGATDAGIPQPR